MSELFDEYGRYIDDILSLFNGDKAKCEWAFGKFNELYPGDLVLTWEFSEVKQIFLNIELYINCEKKIIETKYYVKPTNQRLFLNFRSNHPNHVFKAIVYGMALQGILVNSRTDWNLEYLVDLREKFLQQEYPLNLINEQYARALQVNRMDLLFRDPLLKKFRKARIYSALIALDITMLYI